MQLTQHAKNRMRQRGIRTDVTEFMEYFLPSHFLRNSQRIHLSKHDAKKIARKIRKLADRIEKHSGTELVLDSNGENLITAYRRTPDQHLGQI